MERIQIFRCRDCGAEFEDAGDLEAHCTWTEGHGEEIDDSSPSTK